LSELYLDSAYIAKFYLNEQDSGSVRNLARRATTLCSSALCLAEIACVFHRRVREKSLTNEQATELAGMFMADVEEGGWVLFPVSQELLKLVSASMRDLPADVVLRSGDAIHLITARHAGFSEIWSNDRRLLNAARYFDLTAKSA
jgi:predicted nucleic acid-binding protein